jgi:4-amino-4-deoxy-L-arabinose transferase-like glycosyltransferase
VRLLDTRRPRLLLVMFCLLTWLPGFFLVPPSDRDESRFAQGTKQMLESGDFVDIRNGEEARNRKPIGIYWLQLPGAALARAAGLAHANPAWPYRLPSLLGGLEAVLATWSVGRRLFGPRAAVLAGAMLGASVLLTVETAFAKTDAALLGATTLAMAALARAWMGETLSRGQVALFWLAIGVGILLKGPITPMIVALTVAALVLTDRRATWFGRWLKTLRWQWGLPLVLLVVLPWFVAIGIATHGQFFRDAVGGDLSAKLSGGDDAHGAPPGTHLLLLSLTLFPAAPAVLAACPAAWRARRAPAVRFLLAWIVPAWVVFEAVPTKLPHYPLPVFPALALLAAAWLCGTLEASKPAAASRRWVTRIAGALFVVAAVALAIGALAVPIVLANGISPMLLLALPALVACGVVAWLGLGPGVGIGVGIGVERHRLAAVAASVAAMPLVTWTLLGLELPNLAPLWVAPRVQAALEAHGPRTGFASAGYAEPSLMFVCGTDTRMLPDGASAARFLADAPGRVVLIESRDRADFLAHAAAEKFVPKPFAEIPGFNYSNGRRVALTLYAAPR